MEILPVLSLAVSAAAIAISALTAWYTVLRRGRLQATWPSMVYLGPDGGSGPPKVVLRFLLFTGGARGRAIEHMHVRLSLRDRTQSFSVWVYDDGNGLVRGSGLHVPATGLPAYHHFLLSKSETDFQFAVGQASVEVYAKPVGSPAVRLLRVGPLTVSAEHAEAMRSGRSGLYFDWSSDGNDFDAHLDTRLSDAGRAASSHEDMRDHTCRGSGRDSDAD